MGKVGMKISRHVLFNFVLQTNNLFL